MRTHLENIDLGQICSRFGGGGHKMAAAFSQTIQFFESIVVARIDLFNLLKNY